MRSLLQKIYGCNYTPKAGPHQEEGPDLLVRSIETTGDYSRGSVIPLCEPSPREVQIGTNLPRNERFLYPATA